MPDPLNVSLSLQKASAGRIGEDRIRLLKAVRDAGSISAAARAIGVTYKTAWDGIDALNNLFDRPLVVSQTGGKRGGGATLTREGEEMIAAFEFIQIEIERFAKALDHHLSGAKAVSPSHLIRSFIMRTSARNALHGVIETVTPGAVNAEVTLRISDDIVLTAIVTNPSVETLDLKPGREAVALVKAGFVILAPTDEVGRSSARNRLSGTVIRHDVGAVNDEFVVDLGDGKTVSATVTRISGETLGLKVGDSATALIKASHIILAVD